MISDLCENIADEEEHNLNNKPNTTADQSLLLAGSLSAVSKANLDLDTSSSSKPPLKQVHEQKFTVYKQLKQTLQKAETYSVESSEDIYRNVESLGQCILSNAEGL